MCLQCLFVLGCGLRAPAGISSTSNVLVYTHFDSCLAAMSLDELAPVAYHQPHGLQVILDCQLRLTSARHMHCNQFGTVVEHANASGSKGGVVWSINNVMVSFLTQVTAGAIQSLGSAIIHSIPLPVPLHPEGARYTSSPHLHTFIL